VKQFIVLADTADTTYSWVKKNSTYTDNSVNIIYYT